ncbi:hypothetical protein ES319_A05G212700v1 [Gossypium barbadense]|uniref:Peptidase S8/S53 domain-containing protein n=1 Tax=Gossypium barbadense TaxID=3634 RepID=A0A5J5VRE3_GOSBA|nr:hypothetical protein ES319_A05G212700v1 [Gossypium barbadense]
MVHGDKNLSFIGVSFVVGFIAISGWKSWYVVTLTSSSANLEAKTSVVIPSSKLIYSYNHVIQGFSASLTPAELEALKSTPGYVSSIKEPVSNFGKDIIIGVIDTGWRGECESGTQFNSSMCNKELIGVRFSNKGVVAHNPNVAISMTSPRDTVGHGTHTSTTATGNYVKDASYFGCAMGTARGMALGARVAMYRALCVDVLSMSFGLHELELYEDPIAIATFAAIEKNIFTLPNGTPWVLTVASGTMDRDFGATLSLGNKDTVDGVALFPGNFSSSQFPIVFMDACDEMSVLKKLGQKIVVCQDPGGEGSLSDHIFDFFTPSPFPAIFLEQKDGDSVVDYIKSNSDPKASIDFKITSLGTKPSPVVAISSSRGPSRSCPSVLKPAIMASGDLVLAAWPPNVGVARLNEDLVFSNFNLISATYPDWSLAAIRSALMSTSNTIDNTGIEDYVNLLCALKFTAQQIKIITKSSPNNCSNPSLDLNYPSFIAYFNDKNAKSSSRTVKEFQRTDSCWRGELHLHSNSDTNKGMSFGHLTWEVIGGKHVVKSPIVATSYSLET